LPDLAGVRDREQRRVHDQRLRVADQLGEDGAPQPAQPAVERRGLQAGHAREQAREEPPSVAQEGLLGLDAAKLCWNRASVTLSESKSRFMDS